jgi:hypothetical protein
MALSVRAEHEILPNYVANWSLVTYFGRQFLTA